MLAPKPDVSYYFYNPKVRKCSKVRCYCKIMVKLNSGAVVQASVFSETPFPESGLRNLGRGVLSHVEIDPECPLCKLK